jgi:hypothetical protein
MAATLMPITNNIIFISYFLSTKRMSPFTVST